MLAGEWPQSGQPFILAKKRSKTTKVCQFEGSRSKRGKALKIGKT